MADLLDEFGIGGAQGGGPDLLDEFGIQKKPATSGITRRLVGDTAITALKSAIAVPEIAVGIGDLVTGGRAGKAAEQAGFRPKEAKAFLDDYLSPEQKAANEKLAQADGFVDTLSTAVDNPSTILHTGLESIAPMLAGGVVARGAMAVPGLAGKLAPWAAGAVGEGVVGAGMSAESIRQQTDDGLLTGEQAGLAGLSGLGTGLIGAGGAKIAQKLGIGEIDTLLAGGDAGAATTKGIARKAAEGAAVEGVFQELPQSIQEQALQNIALDKPWDEGLGSAAAMGLLTGAALGGIAGPLGGKRQVQPTPTAENPAPTPVPAPDPNAGAISRTAALLPAPNIAGMLPAPDSVMFADGQGNVSDQGPARDVDREYRPTGRETAPRNFGPGMDQSIPAGSPVPLEGQLIGGTRPQPRQDVRATQTFENEETRALPAPRQGVTDMRGDTINVSPDGTAVPGKIANKPPANYVQGGPGMDQQREVGKTYTGLPAAKRAIRNATNPDQLEVVKVGPKTFEVRAKQKPVKRIVNRDRDSVMHATIRLGGIKTDWRQDTTGDSKGNKFVPGVGALWSDKTGTGLDDMASLLDQNGYVPAGEMERDGGVSWLQQALRDEAGGIKTHAAPGSKLQEAQALKAEAERLEAQAAQEEEGGGFDSAETVTSDLLDDIDLLEIRATQAAAHAAELDAFFGDTPNETVASTQAADQAADGIQGQSESESGDAGSGQRPQGSQPDARAESPAEEAPSLELTQQTEKELAAADAANKARIKAEEKVQAEADEKQRKANEQAQIKAQSEAQADNFTLGVNADDSLSGQSGMFDTQPSLTELGGKPDVSAKNVTPAQPKQTPTAEPGPIKAAATKPEKTKPQVTPSAKVEDFGEKIGGARKDTATPGKKKATKEADGRPAWQRRYEVTQVVTSTSPGEAGRWVISDKRKLDWKKQPKQLRGNYATEEEAMQMLPVIAVAQKHRVLSVRDGDGTGFEIWRDVTDRKRVKVVDQVFPSREAGMEYMAKNAEAIIETNTTFGEADLPRPDSTVRQGAERRTGPVKDSAFTEAFGFRGVEFGNWNNQEERQQLLDDAYDGLMDLAEVMGIPPRAISLNGDLALAFGARGQGLSGARAHYEPGKVVINLTKLNGAGSLAHEWFHALDHYFARQDGKSSSAWAVDKDGTRSLKITSNFENDAASSGFLRNNSGVREVLRDAYTDLMKTMFSKGETYVEDTARVDEFVGRSRKELTDRLDAIRRDLAEQKDPTYWKRNNKPASAEQLAEFDTVAQLVRDGTALSTELRPTPGKSRSVLTSMRWTNDALEKMSEIYKAVRGRTGFNAETNGVLDRLRQSMSAYSSRLKMLADAQSGETKVKKVPTQFAMDAKELDQGRGTDYWTTPHEMAARAFQGYVEDKIAEADGSSPFLNFGPENVAIPTPWGWKRPFPAGEERKAINRSFDKLVGVIQTRETDDGNVALFSRSATGAARSTLNRGDVEQIAVGLVTEATVARRFVFSSWEELPQPIKDRAAAQGAKPGEIKAVHWRGKTYLVDRRFADARDVERVIFHEYYAHYGLRQQYGKDLHRKLLRAWAKSGGTKGVRAMAAAQGFNIDHYIEGAKQDKELTEAQRRVLVMDELLAHMAESTGSLKRLIQEWYGAVRDWLRANGWAELAKLEAADLAFMLRGARQAAQQADGEAVRGQPLFQRTESATQTATAAFKTWFGDSKVVDKQAEPKILYHGTGEDFTVFDQGRSGSSTRHSTAPLGIFMTGDRDTAQAYADKASDGMPGYARIMQLYAAIRNPYMMSVAESQAIESPGDAVTFRAKLEREGYDGINLQGTDTWIAFSNTQVKSATDNNGEFDEWSGDIRFRRSARELFDRATGPAPLDRNDPFAAENRRLREDEKTLWAKAKKVFARQFAPGGLLPEAVFNEKITRDSEFQAVEFDVRHLSSTLSKAVKADFSVDIESLTPAQMKMLAEALAGRVDPTIPESTKVAIVAMRQYIDSLSGEYLSILQRQVEANMEGADQALIDKITGNLGAYVNRSYQAFDDPKWFKTVPTEVVNAARSYLANSYREQGETAAEAARLADVTVNEMLKNGTAYDSMGAFIAEGKLGAKDLTVLIKRKEIAPEIRALLGEYMDPRLNFAKSATKMGRLVWNQRFLDRVLDFGMGTLFFEGKNRPADATTQIAGDQSETYAPLNGLWTFPEVAQAFQDALGKEQMSDLYRTVVRLNGMVKYGKTILSPTTAMRNWQSAMFFSLANGHFDLTQMKKSWAAMREQVTQNATGEDLVYLRKLKQLGVVYDTPYAGEMMALLQDARMDELLSSKSGTGLKWLRKANQFAQGFYSFGDDFWKIIGYENEKASLIGAGIAEAEAEVMAAKRIRDTYPTYSMIGKAVQWLRRFPLAGTFVSFPSEIIRTTVNMFQLVQADLKSDNPKIRALGRKRALGMVMVSGGFYALAALSAAAAGVGDDEEEALRDLAAPWSKNSTFLYTGRDADGKLRYFDLSFLDPYGYWKRPLTAMMRDQPWEKAAASGLSDLLSPFFGADITAGAIFEVLANKKPTGGAVFNPDAGSVDQLQDITNHMRKALQPGFVSNGERLWLAFKEARREGSGQPYDMRDELVSLLGWRASTLDTQTGLYYRSFDFTDGLANAKKTLTRTLRSSNKVSEGDIREAKQAADAQYQKAFTEMGRLVSAAGAAGMSRSEIVQTLKLSGVAQRNIAALVNGRVPPMDIGLQAQTKAVRQAVVMRDREHGAEIARRFRLAREE